MTLSSVNRLPVCQAELFGAQHVPTASAPFRRSVNFKTSSLQELMRILSAARKCQRPTRNRFVRCTGSGFGCSHYTFKQRAAAEDASDSAVQLPQMRALAKIR